MRVSSEQLSMALSGLEMDQDPGLIFVADKDFQENFSIRFALETAERYKADAVYFRYFHEEKRIAQQIYIYDFTQSHINQEIDENIPQLHKKLWNSGQVPLFFVFTRSEVKIFNCLKSPDLEKDKLISRPLETIRLAAEIEKEIDRKLKKFSAKLFANGSFWEQSEYRNKFNIKDSAYEQLLIHLKARRKELLDKEVFKSKSLVNKFLLMSILVKYLEDREDEQGNRVFPNDFFNQFDNSENFAEVLRKDNLSLELFNHLSQHFNGKIFEWSPEEEEQLKGTDFSLIAELLDATTELTGQRRFWKLYSFNDLPVELISNIYEEFSSKPNKKDKEGVIYTPPYLVNFLIDESMPVDEPKENFKVLDPACGSGIFLVGAFRRMIEWWRVRNNLEKPDLKKLKEILINNIYGVDIEPEAVSIAVFSLSLALCDFLSPRVIWEELKFEDLSMKNLITEDFFKLICENKLNNDFDFIIGNPPFVESLGEYGNKIEKQKEKGLPKIPGKQRALLFLEQAMKICKDKGLLCLILPSGPLLYNEGVLEFRKNFLLKYNVPQIIDFSYLSSTLFGEGGNVPVSALFVKNEPMIDTELLHIVVKRTKATKEKLYFELDHYDFNYVDREVAINNRFVWKANFLGGGRILDIITRLNKIEMKFGEYLENKIKNHGWFVGEGYIEAKKGDKEAPFITGKLSLPTEAFSENGIDETKLFNLMQKHFYRTGGTGEIYNTPHVLIKELAGKTTIPVEFIDYYLTFTQQVIGIYASEKEIPELKNIVARIKNNRNFLFYVSCSSGRLLITKSTAIMKKDIENLPWPENEEELNLHPIEEIIRDDVLDHLLEFRRKGEGSKIIMKPEKNHLSEFGKVYCDILNSVFKEDDKQFYSDNYLEEENFIIFPFYYGTQNHNFVLEPEDVINAVNNLLEKQIHTNLRMIRVIRLYHDNVVFLIKPNQLRYWLKSVAIRDADETFSELYEQGF